MDWRGQALAFAVRSSKLKVQSSKEAPNAKFQTPHINRNVIGALSLELILSFAL
jgi:hypothetical protein